MKRAIGIDLGGTNIKAVLVDATGQILERASRETNDFAFSIREWAATVADLIQKFEEPLDAQGKVGVGIAAPGLAAADERSIAFLPDKLHGIEGFDWTTFLHRESRAPVLNDAHAALLGEAWIGAAAGFRNVILLTLGTGVGGAILADGRLMRGAIGRAGLLGHVCLDVNGPPSIVGMPGSIEDAIGNRTVAARSDGRFSSTHALVEAHLSGDAAASAIWLRSIRALACAVASYINILDPEAVIIGGGIARAGVPLFEPLEKELERIEWRPGGHRARLLPAVLGEWAGACGAAAYAMDENGRRTDE